MTDMELAALATLVEVERMGCEAANAQRAANGYAPAYDDTSGPSDAEAAVRAELQRRALLPAEPPPPAPAGEGGISSLCVDCGTPITGAHYYFRADAEADAVKYRCAEHHMDELRKRLNALVDAAESRAEQAEAERDTLRAAIATPEVYAGVVSEVLERELEASRAEVARLTREMPCDLEGNDSIARAVVPLTAIDEMEEYDEFIAATSFRRGTLLDPSAWWPAISSRKSELAQRAQEAVDAYAVERPQPAEAGD